LLFGLDLLALCSHAQYSFYLFSLILLLLVKMAKLVASGAQLEADKKKKESEWSAENATKVQSISSAESFLREVSEGSERIRSLQKQINESKSVDERSLVSCLSLL